MSTYLKMSNYWEYLHKLLLSDKNRVYKNPNPDPNNKRTKVIRKPAYSHIDAYNEMVHKFGQNETSKFINILFN